MKNKYSEYFKLVSETVIQSLLTEDFETSFEDKYEYNCSRKWKNLKTGIIFHISFLIVEGKYFFSGAIYSKQKPTAIDFDLLIPMYYPEFPKNLFTPNILVDSEVSSEIDHFFKHLSIAIKSLPLSEIVNGDLWLDGFKHYPQDQVLGIPWTPPEKIIF